ncbi:MAG: PIN domain-containing protein [Ottowia sp.]|uniref:type II toxin-antitoxin system VapC family toxin n=1 Tax=Ottowia sp. TaxID=1898956 RepID=UPI0039E66704
MSQSHGPSPLHVAEPPARWLVTPRGQVLVDSGPLLALFNAADHWHAPVAAWLKAHPDVALVSTWPVLTEVCALLARRVHNQAALDFLLWVERGALRVDAPAEASLAQMRRIAQRFADLPLDLADASIAEAAERLGLRRILSVDADFDVYRDARGRPLTNLLR